MPRSRRSSGCTANSTVSAPFRHFGAGPSHRTPHASCWVSYANTSPATSWNAAAAASTILFGHLQLAGEIDRLIAIEHDIVWHELARQQARRFGLEDTADLVFAPLIDHDDPAIDTPWYDLTDVDFAPLDLVLVDGPPDSTGPLARFPAAPLLLEHCRPGCLFVVDDYIRESEQETVDLWVEHFPMTLIAVHESPEKRLAVVRYDGDEGADDD